VKEIRKRVSDLVVGDEVKGYGVLLSSHSSPRFGWFVRRSDTTSSGCDYWPADAEVTVLVRGKRWRVTFETDSPAVAQMWRSRDEFDYGPVTVEEIEP
jgi:hypothetical protein